MRETKRIAFNPNGYIEKGVAEFKRSSRFLWEFPFYSGGDFWAAMLLQDEMLKREKFDGIIAPVFNEREQDIALSFGVPVVNTLWPFDGCVLPTVTFDDYGIGQLAAQHLLESGFSHFYCIGYHSGHFWDARLEGFRDVLAEAGRECKRIHAKVTECEQVIDGIAANPSGLIETLKRMKKPAAIFCDNDYAGFNVLVAARRMGIAVPDELCVVGVDNEAHFCNFTSPELSSIDRNEDRTGFMAAEMLEKLMAGEELTEKQILVPPAGVIQRASSDILSVKDPHVAEALRFIRANIRQNLTVIDVLKQIPVSRRTLERDFKEAVGTGIYKMIQETRLKVAEDLLRNTAHTVERVAYESGFPNILALQSALKKSHRMTANAFRQYQN